MTGIVGAVALIAMLAVVLRLVTGGSASRLALGTGETPSAVAVLEGLVGAVAAASLMAALPTGVAPAASVGAALGLVAAVRSAAPTWSGLGTVIGLFYGAIGVLAAIMAVTELFNPICSAAMPVPAFIIVLLVVSIAGLYFLTSFLGIRSLTLRRLPAVGLGWFAAVETIALLASPLGVALFPGQIWFYSALIAFSALAGVGLGILPEAMFAVLGTVFLVATAAAAVEGTSACLIADTSAMVVTLVAYLAVFTVCGMVARPFR